MNVLNTFEVFIFNQNSEVSCGSNLCGQIVVDCEEDLEINEISVHFYGKCRVQLFDYRICSVSLTDVHGTAYAAHMVNEIIMHEVAVCLPNGESDEQTPETESCVRPSRILPKGYHEFNFKVKIGNNLPASFDGNFGYTRYFIRAQIHSPHGVEYNTRNFTVLPVMDLNCLPEIESAVEENMETEIFFFFKSIGFYRAKMSLLKSGYVLGDALDVRLDIHNNTFKDITRAVLKLKMVTTYETKYQTRQTESILCTSNLSPIQAGYTFHGCDRNLRIPKDAPVTNVHAYRHIYVEYFVELCIQPSLISLYTFKMSAKIEVGTMPISDERLTASLILRQPPPRYEDLLPRYEDAIKHCICIPDYLDDSQHQISCSPDQDSLLSENTIEKNISSKNALSTILTDDGRTRSW